MLLDILKMFALGYTLCGTSPTDTFYVSTNQEIDDLSHCNILNGNKWTYIC